MSYKPADDLTFAGLDLLAKHPKWGDVKRTMIPADVIAAANAGHALREPNDDDLKGVGHGIRSAWTQRDARDAKRGC